MQYKAIYTQFTASENCVLLSSIRMFFFSHPSFVIDGISKLVVQQNVLSKLETVAGHYECHIRKCFFTAVVWSAYLAVPEATWKSKIVKNRCKACLLLFLVTKSLALRPLNLNMYETQNRHWIRYYSPYSWPVFLSISVIIIPSLSRSCNYRFPLPAPRRILYELLSYLI
jgi:hypothetical protein